MNNALLLIPALLLILSVCLTVALFKRGRTARQAMAVQLLSLVAIAAVSCALPTAAKAETAPAPSAAEQTAGEETAAENGAAAGMKYLGTALAVGLSCIGGGIAVAAGAPAAIGATAEDPKSFGKSIIFVALGEGFGLYGLVISIMILSN